MKRLRELFGRLWADKKLRALFFVFAAGLVLLALSGTSVGSRQQAKQDDTDVLRTQTETALENRLARLLSSVSGVGKVKVLITLEQLQGYAYAQDAGADGTEKYVIVKQNGSENGLAVAVTSPVVRGVAVSCEGGGSAAVRQEVVRLVCAALGVGANRVYVSALAP